MNIKHITIDCPKCGEKLTNSIWYVNTPTNEFDVFELERTEFHCKECDLDIYIGDIYYETSEDF